MAAVTNARPASSPFFPELGALPGNVIDHAVVDVLSSELQQRDAVRPQAVLLVGFSGSGKTTWLDGLERKARSLQWAVVAEEARGDMFHRCTEEHIPALFKALGGKVRGRRVTGFSVPQFSDCTDSQGSLPQLQGSLPQLTEDSWVRKLDDIAVLLEQYDSGILFTIDNVAAASLDQLSALFTGVSRLQKLHNNIAFIATMERSEYAALINKQKGEFLQEFAVHFMPLLPLEEVSSFFEHEVNVHGKQWEAKALDMAVSKTYGYPFLVQLIGHYSWLASDSHTLISTQAVAAGSVRAMLDFEHLIIEPIIGNLSELDVLFLRIMAALGTPTKIADIVHEMNRSADTVAQYRRRLVDRGYITIVKRGWVEFAVPGFQTYFEKATL